MSPDREEESSAQNPSYSQSLAQTLRDRSMDLEEKVLKGEDVDPQTLKELEHIQSLLAIRSGVEPRKRSHLLWTIVLFIIALAIPSILHKWPLSITEIEIDLVVSELSFTFNSERDGEIRTLIDDIDLLNLVAVGLEQLEFDPRENLDYMETDSQKGITLKLSKLATVESSLTLQEVVVPSNMEVRLQQKQDVPGYYMIGLKGKSQLFNASTKGSVLVNIFFADLREAINKRLEQSNAPRGIDLVGGTGDSGLQLQIQTSDKRPINIFQQLPINKLCFSRIFKRSHFKDDKGIHTEIRSESTIQAGGLYFLELGDAKRELRSGEELRLEIEKGEIRRIVSEKDGFHVQFMGRVKDVKTGPVDNQRSLMPNVLEWLMAHHSMKLIWATALYLFGLAFGVYRWWRGGK